MNYVVRCGAIVLDTKDAQIDHYFKKLFSFTSECSRDKNLTWHSRQIEVQKKNATNTVATKGS